MLFRRIVLAALLVGGLSGLLLSIIQWWQVIPVIHGAERYEKARVPQVAVPAPHSHESHAGALSHVHEATAWEPAEGSERTGFTVLSNVLTGIGFGLIMLAAMVAVLMRNSSAQFDWHHGLLWGAAGYLVFFVAPSLGLPPAIPGVAETPLEARQLWWALAVLSTAVGLAVLAFGKHPWRLAALLLIAIPHVVGAPNPPANPFAEYPPEAAAALAKLALQFIWATALANALYWLALGTASVWAVRRFLKDAVAV